MSSISDGIEREKKSVQAFFTENVDLEFYDMSRTYCTFKVTGVNGIKPENTLLVSFYDDLAYISDRDLRDGFAGKLTVFDKVSQYNAESYSRKFRTADCKNPRYMKCPAVGEKVSFVEMLCKAYLRAGRGNDIPEQRGVLQAAVALGLAGKFDVDTLPESIEGFVAWMADQAPKPEPVVGKLTDEKLIAELMEDYGWPREETVNGYGEFTMHGANDYDIDGAVEICRIDELYMDKRTNYGFDGDWDACRQAEKDGVKFINDIDGLEKGRYVDTPENRAICAAYLHAHPQSRIENWFSSAGTTYQNDYVERFGDPTEKMVDQVPKSEPVVGKLTDEKLIAELMKDYGWPREDTINGYFIVEVSSGDYEVDGALEIERIDDLHRDGRVNYGFYDDWGACRQAEKDGVKFINDMDGLEKGRYIDTPKNRKICASYLAERPDQRIENYWAEMPEDFQALYIERFGSPIQKPSIESLKKRPEFKVDLGFAELVVAQGDPEYKEVNVYLMTKDGDIQDLVEIGQEYSYDEYSDLVFKPSVSVKVYADRNNEDFTHDFSIGLYEGFGLNSRTASLAQSTNAPEATPSLNLGDRLAVATVSAEARNASRQDTLALKPPSKDQR